MPEPYTISIASGIISSLAANMLQNTGVKLRRTIARSGQEEALRRSVQAGVAAFLGVIQTGSKAELDHLDKIFRDFFGSKAVAEELAILLEGELPEQDMLLKEFEKAGYIVEELPRLNFALSMQAFQQTFIAAAAGESGLADTIQSINLIKQSGLQRESLETLKQIAAVLKEMKTNSLQMASGSVSGNIADTGQKCAIDFTRQLLPYFSALKGEASDRSVEISGDVRESLIITGDKNTVEAFFNFGTYYAAGQGDKENNKNTTAERDRYLNRLMSRCRILPLSALGEDSGTGEELSLDQVYVALDTKTTREPTDVERKELEEGGVEVNEHTRIPVRVMEASGRTFENSVVGRPWGPAKAPLYGNTVCWWPKIHWRTVQDWFRCLLISAIYVSIYCQRISRAYQIRIVPRDFAASLKIRSAASFRYWRQKNILQPLMKKSTMAIVCWHWMDLMRFRSHNVNWSRKQFAPLLKPISHSRC